MKSLIVYSSQSGNTRKLAEVVYERLQGEKEICTIEEAPETSGYDFIAVGFWLMAGKPDPKTLEFLPKIGRDKKVFLFATHGAAPGSDHAKAGINYARELLSTAAIAGVFDCQGEVNPKVLEKASSKPEPPSWLKDAPLAVGHPDDTDINHLLKIVDSI